MRLNQSNTGGIVNEPNLSRAKALVSLTSCLDAEDGFSDAGASVDKQSRLSAGAECASHALSSSRSIALSHFASELRRLQMRGFKGTDPSVVHTGMWPSQRLPVPSLPGGGQASRLQLDPSTMALSNPNRHSI